MKAGQSIRSHERAEWLAQDILAADEAPLREALESVRWERRGWLGRLVPLERAAAEPARRTRDVVRRPERLVA